MNEKFKKFLASKNISEADFATKTAQEMGALYNEFYQKELENKAEKADIPNIEESLKGYLKEDAIEALKTQLTEMQESVNQMKDQTNGIPLETIEKQVAEFVEKNYEKIKTMQSSGQGFVEFQVKAVGNMTTGSASYPVAAPALSGPQQAPAQNVNLRTDSVWNMTSNLNTSLAAYPYTETVPKDGDYTFVAEGVAKPQIDFKIETRYASPVKLAAWVKLTEESVQDIAGLQSIATDYLRKKHDRKRAKSILTGDGIAPNPKGATKYGRAFVAGDMALAVTNPNFMDVINAAITDIYITHNYEDEMNYMANIVLVNPVDFFLNLVSAKDANGIPLYPTASLYNQVTIGGATIMPDEDIPAGKIFVADMSKYNTTNYMSYTVKIGWVNDDFIKNQFVILGESRFHAFVKKLDEQAFLYDDIDTIKTAITAA